jgi:outer membrane protein
MYYKFYETISVDYKEKRAKTEKQLQSRYLKLQDDIANVQKRAQAGLMSQNDIAKAEQDLGLKQQEFQMLQNSLQEGLIAEEQNLMKQLNDKMINYLKKYNTDKKYDMIFSYGAGSPILVASEALDITKPILDGLNAEYEAEAKNTETKTEEKK